MTSRAEFDRVFNTALKKRCAVRRSFYHWEGRIECRSITSSRYREHNASVSELITVEPLITHTDRWTGQGMGYQRVWVWGGVPKIELKKLEKIILLIKQHFQWYCIVDEQYKLCPLEKVS